MRKLLTATTLALLAPLGVTLASSATASASTTPAAATTTTLGPPIQSAGHHPLFLYVDTVQGSSGSPKPSAPCGMTNLFQATQQVVFRMWGVDVRTGGMALTDENVKSAWVTVPGVSAPIQLVYGTHGTVSYWTAAWVPGSSYPLGVVSFHVTVVTKPAAATATSKAIPSLSTVFSQNGMPATSRLTVT